MDYNKYLARRNDLRQVMASHGVDVWLAPTNDFHGSEYVGDYFLVKEFLTGYTGDAGTLLVTMTDAFLWVDGRFTVQAKEQLKGTKITIFATGEADCPSVEQFLMTHMQNGQTLGFDGRLVSASWGRELTQVLETKGISVQWEQDLVDLIWQDRPPFAKGKAYFLSADFVGESRQEKLRRVRLNMAEQGAEVHLLTSLDDIAWIYNLRGQDITYNPVAQAYSVITEQEAFLFIQEEALSTDQKAMLAEEGIQVLPYETVLSWLQDLPPCTLLLDPEKASYALALQIPEIVQILEEPDPSVHMKAIKNATEIAHIKEAHLKDGVAMTKFCYWVKHPEESGCFSELSAEAHLEALRQTQDGYLEPSFEPISAYGPHGAMCHYAPTEESDLKISREGFYLADTGGQYIDGTTDVTRTFALGPVSESMRQQYTLVLKGMIDLSKARFRYGMTGLSLDYLARGPLWEHGLDYQHGTGHGVGFLLNVHEPPNFIHWKLKERECTVWEAGMLTSNEPGYYEEDSHGIRIENLLLCVPEETETGSSPDLKFETVTLCPIDLDAVDLSYLDCEERSWLNDYHQKVYEQIGPKLTEKEAQWLYQVTRPI